MTQLTHNPSQTLPVKPFVLCPVHYSTDSAVAGSCLQTPCLPRSPQMHYSASDYYLSFLGLDLKSFLGLGVETHRCCPSAVEYRPGVVDCFDRSHPAQVKNGMLQRTCLREVAAAAADSGVDSVGRVEMVVAVFGLASGLAGLVVVPRLLDQGFAVVSEGFLRGREIL